MFDFRYMSLGGGVQSGTMAEMIAEGDLERPDVVIFADTGDEPQYVYDYVTYLTGRLGAVGVPLVVVSAGSLIDNLTSATKRFAAIPAYSLLTTGKKSMLRRQCTYDFKIAPIEKELRRRLLAAGWAKLSKNGRVYVNRRCKVEAWLGISTDEVARMKPNRTKFITNAYPLIQKRMSRQDCVSYLSDKGLPVPHKSACRICPFHDNSYWRSMGAEDFQHAVEIDEFLRSSDGRFAATAKGELFLHSSCIPLAEAVTRDAGQGDNQFETEDDLCDSGYCFV